MASTSFFAYQSENPVLVVNLDVINRQLKALGPAVEQAAKKGMLEGAEPIRRDAEVRALRDISGMKRKKNSDWDLQREGSTVHEVYIVPVERGDKKRRDGNPDPHKFKDIMFGKSYDPAFEAGKPAVVAFVDKWLTTVSGEFNSATGRFI